MNQQPTPVFRPPTLHRTPQGDFAMASLADVIEWFLTYDERVAVMRAPPVEEIFQWKQSETLRAEPDAYTFARAEDRFAVGVLQALAENADECSLHGWLTDVLNALEEAKKLNEEIAKSFNLNIEQGAPAMQEADKLPSPQARMIFLNACWLEALCTAEARALGWFYQELYGRAYNPQNF